MKHLGAVKHIILVVVCVVVKLDSIGEVLEPCRDKVVLKKKLKVYH
jgi:hypothetical protein